MLAPMLGPQLPPLQPTDDPEYVDAVDVPNEEAVHEWLEAISVQKACDD